MQEDHESGWAPALHYCEHVNRESVKMPRQNLKDCLRATCEGCDNKDENWLCASCGQVLCGRFAQGHMKQHYESTRHCIAVGLGDLSFWCYECDSYLHHLKIRRIYHLYSQLHYAKFDEAVPVEFEGNGDDNDDDFKDRGQDSSDDDDSANQVSVASPADQTMKSNQTSDTKKPPPSSGSSSSHP